MSKPFTDPVGASRRSRAPDELAGAGGDVEALIGVVQAATGLGHDVAREQVQLIEVDDADLIEPPSGVAAAPGPAYHRRARAAPGSGADRP
jgi:hypothetical protein